MKLSARTRYAARLLLDLALFEEDRPLRAISLAENTGISVQFIEQIIRPLKKAGFIKSVRGAAGGHILDMAPERITLGEIVRVMEGGITLADCLGDPDTCHRSDTCKTRKVWDRASNVLQRELDSITLADLMHDDGCL